ncbi:Mrp/NBP35 family ATP-binding protein [Sedimenticola hydrogenitrophicus]|uniref:Mrp/NBP35 family ATP-binding protein n=1 Tax=Sedimenticola hydrogenitrophicus TaxID=2967975 RepID=UPI0021A95303|nr:Mrp/NBP35 family ATP-binding protein [Sedimenticola hydrogenitrophicus]
MSRLPEFPIPIQIPAQANPASAADESAWYAEPQAAVAGIEDIVLVASGKGGVGKSTVTVNLACALAQAGKRVGILDADLYGPSITRMMGTERELPVDDEGRTLPVENHGVWTVSVGNVLPPEAALVWKGPLVTQALTQMFHDIAWPELDILLVDLPPGTGDVPLTILEQIPVSGAVLVTTPQKLSIVDAARGIAMFHDLDIPVFGLVENMNSYICPCCGEVQALFPDGAAESLAQRKSVKFLGGIPLDPEGQLLTDGGTPLVVSRPQGTVAQLFVGVAAELASAVERERAFRARDSNEQMRAEHEAFWENLLDD